MATLVAAVAGVIPSATEHWILWEIPYSRACHYERIYWMRQGVTFFDPLEMGREIAKLKSQTTLGQ